MRKRRKTERSEKIKKARERNIELKEGRKKDKKKDGRTKKKKKRRKKL